MPKPRPPYLQKEIDRHGKTRWYVRIRPNPRIAIHGDYGTAEFMENYRAAIGGVKKAPISPTSNSLTWLIAQYRKSADWLALAQSTRRYRENIFLQVTKKAGNVPYKAITKKVIIKSRDERAATPAQAGNFLKTMNGLFKWAYELELVSENPVAGVKFLKSNNKAGIAVWEESDIEKYYAKWPLGTKERVWLDVLLYTGLRRGDAVRVGKQHVRNGIISIKTEKSGFNTEVTLPILPVLQRTLDAGPTGDLAFICGAAGNPLVKESFGNLFREACNKAGVNKTAHGVRKISATRAANAGATMSQLKAIYGWTSDDMPSLYTKSADRRRLAIEAIEKLDYKNK